MHLHVRVGMLAMECWMRPLCHTIKYDIDKNLIYEGQAD